MHMAIQTVLCLYASGRTTDIVTDSDGVSRTVFIHDGFAFPLAILRFAGRDITVKLVKILTQPEYSFIGSAEREIAPDVKQILCYMRLDYHAEHKSTAPINKEKTYVLPNIITVVELKSTADSDNEKTYELPDGNISTVGAKRFRWSKWLFQPNYIVEGASGIHDSSLQSNMKYDVDLRKNWYAMTCSQVARTCSKGWR